MVSIILLVFLILPDFACKKDEVVVYPTITTKDVITGDTDDAEGGGIIDTDGNLEILMRGVVWGPFAEPSFESNEGFTTDGDGTGEYKSFLTDIKEGIIYNVRAYAKTPIGFLYGQSKQFRLSHKPFVSTFYPSGLTYNSAMLKGILNPNYYETNVSFQIGKTTAYEMNDQVLQGAVNGGLTYIASVEITGLEPNTTYHYRIVARNEIGVAYGEDVAFSTRAFIADFDGNKYSILPIGTQVWLMEDLMTRHYSNGDNLSYYAYDGQADNPRPYGYYYDKTVIMDVRNVCPTGWHVPNIDDINKLVEFVGEDYGGNMLKETGARHWKYPNEFANNQTEFTGLPQGDIKRYGFSEGRGEAANWWIADNINYSTTVLIFSLYHNSQAVDIRKVDGGYNLSVRCIRGIVPWVGIADATELKRWSAILNGAVHPKSNKAEVVFEYWEDTPGSSIKTAQAVPNTVDGDSLVPVSAKVENLKDGKYYYFRAIATSSDGRSISMSRRFRASGMI